MKQIIVVGGGCSGLVSAITLGKKLHENGMKSNILIIEKNDSLGKKLLATGNGRCNMSNLLIDMKYFHGHHKEIVQSIINEFDVVKYFESIGLWTKWMGNLLYPQSEQAKSVLNCFQRNLSQYSIHFKTNELVTSIKKSDSFIVTTNRSQYVCDYVIMATGSDAACHLGGDKIGYQLFQKLNHHVYPTTPALVQLKCQNMDKSLKGVRIHGTFRLYANHTLIKEETGEILFTEYGLSGISILQLSRYYYVYDFKKIEVEIDSLDQYTDKQLACKLKQLLQVNNVHPFHSIVNQKYADFLEKQFNESFNDQNIDIMVHLLKHYRFKISGTKDKQSAQVCSGGVSLKEFCSKTLESKLIPGLYGVGEVLDIDGDCGGYNLHFAFASAYQVGNAIFKQIMMEEKYVKS